MTGQLLFDRLRFFDHLRRAGVSDDQARAHVEAIDEAFPSLNAASPWWCVM